MQRVLLALGIFLLAAGGVVFALLKVESGIPPRIVAPFLHDLFQPEVPDRAFDVASVKFNHHHPPERLEELLKRYRAILGPLESVGEERVEGGMGNAERVVSVDLTFEKGVMPAQAWLVRRASHIRLDRIWMDAPKHLEFPEHRDKFAKILEQALRKWAEGSTSAVLYFMDPAILVTTDPLEVGRERGRLVAIAGSFEDIALAEPVAWDAEGVATGIWDLTFSEGTIRATVRGRWHDVAWFIDAVEFEIR